MKKVQKGFTLVELLAVIVVLAVVVVVIVPIAVNVIKEAREKAAIESFKGYMDAVEKTIVQDSLYTESKLPNKDNNGCYLVDELGNTIKMKGNKPKADDDDDKVCVEKGKIKSISEVIVDGYKLEYKDEDIYLNGKNTTIEIESIEITNINKKVYVGETLQLTTRIEPTNGDTSRMKWESTDTNVATVDSNGVVTGVSKGTTTIKVTTRSKKTASIEIKVKIRPTSISITNEETEMYTEDTLQLQTSITPSGTEETLEWTSSEPTVATVSSTGLVTALTPGTTTITVETESGATTTKTITVKLGTVAAVVGENATEDSGLYYYKGNVSNNNIIFGGYCWKIMHTTSTNGTKLIYNGTVSSGECNGTTPNIGSSIYNSTYNSGSYNSTAKSNVDTWYNNNLASYASWLENTSGRLKVELITKEEVDKIGANSYLNSGQNYWTETATGSTTSKNISMSCNNGCSAKTAAATSNTIYYISSSGTLTSSDNGTYYGTTTNSCTVCDTYITHTKIGTCKCSSSSQGCSSETEKWRYYCGSTAVCSESCDSCGGSCWNAGTHGCDSYRDGNCCSSHTQSSSCSASSTGSSQYLRPVVSLSNKVAITGGNGTSANPYTVELAN